MDRRSTWTRNPGSPWSILRWDKTRQAMRAARTWAQSARRCGAVSSKGLVAKPPLIGPPPPIRESPPLCLRADSDWLSMGIRGGWPFGDGIEQAILNASLRWLVAALLQIGAQRVAHRHVEVCTGGR